MFTRAPKSRAPAHLEQMPEETKAGDVRSSRAPRAPSELRAGADDWAVVVAIIAR